MSLPPFIKFAYNYGTEEVIRRGKRIFHTKGVQFMDVDHLIHQIRFRVRNDQYNNYYTVTVSKFNDERGMAVRCQCPYNLGDICRHEVAALFQLAEMANAGFFEETDVSYEQQHTLVRMRAVTAELISVFTKPDSLETAKAWASEGRVRNIEAHQERLSAEVPEGDKVYAVQLRQNDERYFDTSCACEETSHPLCRHKAAVFLQILQQRGAAFFRSLQNWDAQKEKLLSLYGYSLKDDLTGKFDFNYQDGRPILKVLDPNIKKIAIPVPEPEPAVQAVAAIEEVQEETKKTRQRIGVVADAGSSLYPGIEWRLVAGEAEAEAHQFTGNIEALDLQQYIGATNFPQRDRDLINSVRKLSPGEVLRYLKKTLPFGDLWDEPAEVLKEDISAELSESVWEFLLPRYQRLLGQWSAHPLCFVHLRGSALSSTTITPVEFSAVPASPSLHILPVDDGVDVQLRWEVGKQVVPFGEATMLGSGLVMESFTLHALSSLPALKLAEQFLPDGLKHYNTESWPAALQDEVMAWHSTAPLHFDDRLVEQSSTVKPAMRIYLSERDKVLVLQPAFIYGNVEIRLGYEGDITVPHNGRVRVIRRQQDTEAEYLQNIKNLHSDMQRAVRDHFFYLNADAVLAGSWFFRFMDAMREQEVSVVGLEELKKLRISTFKPKTEVRVSSGIDWFDTEVEVAFGDQRVSIADIKKALTNQQHFVPLDDGSIGLLPEDWVKKYGLLIKMGESQGGKLRLKKFHFSVLDALLEEVDEEKIQHELEEKKEQLSAIIERDFSSMAPPPQLKAELRPYQHAGFQWLAFLREAGWGGILADDMGLGKTVQALSYLQHLVNELPEARFLVICPTTLMYNWEAEIRKFTPELRHYIHHGPKRTHKAQDLEAYHVVITTYGTMRSDIRWLKDVIFDYTILDESQAIKNPQSQVAKASLLLRSKNKLALSGTPVQNNTFDLYAQMNFLNPGLLGTREFFANEFATPIDKFREEEVTLQLRQLIYPFMLRRTKEQVAKDLPEKTETILYCEMGPEQRKIYNAYRNTYKDQLLGMIDERGIERATFHILQGLTRLRQICDSPAILNEEERLPNHSVKSEELIREITENVGNHKALVFSQFLGMLAIIRKQLEEAGIQYAYFDGSSSATERERAIQMFQNDEECRVFLISLKAGGVGLNLTAADYVYLVDPWWNPAVEQQAIDRTHRIGQTKAIFAYRLICKDTIEEKMLILQERKRALAADLVADDSAVLKRLTRDDIAFLLS
jgi:superfamily II DNA or RNA helicase